jgi:hypothetical protein
VPVVAGVADAGVAVAVARVVAEVAEAAVAVAVGAFAEVAVAAEEFADVVVAEGLILDPNWNALAEGMLEALIAYANP